MSALSPHLNLFDWHRLGASFRKDLRDQIQMRLINNFRVYRAQELARQGEFSKAKKAAQNLVQRAPHSVGFNLLLADIELFSGNLENARKQYEATEELIELSAELSERNKRYLVAYADFRTIAVKYRLAGQKWSEWRAVAKLVDDLDADKRFKRVFRLPT
nr:hypothetical protein [Sulfitobacter mediterraneus]